MKRIALALAFAALAMAGKPPEWKTGKIADANSANSYVQTSTDKPITIRESQVLIVGSEYAYVINDATAKQSLNPIGSHIGLVAINRATANRGKGCRYIVGDPISYWQEKDKLHVRDADGKECKVEIVRQERIAAKP